VLNINIITQLNCESIFRTKISITDGYNIEWNYWKILLAKGKALHHTFVVINKGNSKITELRTILQRESQKS
jgi:hypothetical protein